jgi:hypothetical protein
MFLTSTSLLYSLRGSAQGGVSALQGGAEGGGGGSGWRLLRTQAEEVALWGVR